MKLLHQAGSSGNINHQPAADSILQFIAELHSLADSGEWAVLQDRRGAKKWEPYQPTEWVESWRTGQMVIPEVLLNDVRDKFTTVNTFHKAWFVGALAKRLNVLFVDIDCYNPGLMAGRPGVPGEVMWEHLQAIDFFREHNLPEPWAIASGQGLLLLWPLEGEHTMLPGRGNRWVWQRCEERLLELLAEHGADTGARDVSKFFRLVGSYHPNGNQVRTLHFPGERHSLESMAKALKVPLVWNIPEKTARRSKVARLPLHFNPKTFGRYTLGHNRAHDLALLSELRGGLPEGDRNFAVMQYSTCLWRLAQEPGESVLAECEAFNETFSPPLSAGEVSRVVAAVTRHDNVSLNKRRDKRIASNRTIITRLRITLQEQQHLLTIIGKVEKTRRVFMRAHETPKGRLVLEAMWGNPHLTQQVYAELTKVSQATVSRVLRGTDWHSKSKRGRPRKYNFGGKSVNGAKPPLQRLSNYSL